MTGEWKADERIMFIMVPPMPEPERCEECGTTVSYKHSKMGTCRCCGGHEPGPYEPMGVTVYCDGTCHGRG